MRETRDFVGRQETNVSRRDKLEGMPLKIAELFAGVGGFRVGLEKSGHQVVFSNQWEPSTKVQHASSVYVRQFGQENHSCEDVAKIQQFPSDVDMIVGGFPCQDYSVAKTLGASRGIQGKKGVLWWEILRLAKEHSPQYLFLENVDRLLKSPSSQRGRDFAIMLSTLNRAGYTVEWKTVNSASYGFPQRRKRVFIFATRVETNPTGDLYERVSESGTLAKAFKSELIEEPRRLMLDDDLLNISEDFNLSGKSSPFLDSGVAHDNQILTATSQPVYSGPKQNLGDILQNLDEVDKSFLIKPEDIEKWAFHKGAKRIERIQKDSGYKYNYSEGSMSFPDQIDRPSRTILTGEGGPTPARIKHAISQGGVLRRLTPIELERLNGFPDEWTRFGQFGEEMSDSRRAFFMGNALITGLIKQVGDVLVKGG